jgi:hypothetical protein
MPHSSVATRQSHLFRTVPLLELPAIWVYLFVVEGARFLFGSLSLLRLS